ncbi:MAG: hypothetical protein RLZZ316_2713 [Bacteroidota bacterium]|jgi:hypothetical protein
MCPLPVFVAISTADEPSVATTAAQCGAVGYIKNREDATACSTYPVLVFIAWLTCKNC